LAGSDVLPDLVQCDVCIIGSGPAGMTIARELSGTSLRVTLLESGGMERQEASDALNEIESVGWTRAQDQWTVRNRIVGGSSATWWSRCAPFDEIDMEQRDWVPYSGWPVKAGDLTSYIERSAKYLGQRDHGQPGLGAHGASAHDHWSRPGSGQTAADVLAVRPRPDKSL
jgi:choline dehydrogenase-like flavoprotein